MPGTAVTDPGMPGHVPPVTGPGATVTPAGRVSTIAAVNVAIDPFGFVNVIDKFDIPPDEIVAGVNNLATDGVLVTVNGADAGRALLPRFVCNAPAMIVFVTIPSVEDVTSTVIVQLLDTGFSARKFLAFSRPWPSCSPS